jgi:hypothetical protein
MTVEAPKLPEGKTVNLFVTDEVLEGSSRRTNLALELLSVLSEHEIDGESDADSTAEAVAVMVTTAAFLVHSFKSTERNAVKDYRDMFRIVQKASERLGPRATARDIFTEIAVMASDKA